MNSLSQRLYDDFIDKGRYMYLVKGLGNTVLITVFALLIGVVILALLSTTAVIRRACARIRDAGVRYAEDNMWRLLMFEGITPVYFPRAAVRYECAVGISASDVWKKRLLDDWAAADRLMREMPSPDAAQQKLLRALWPEGRLAEAVRVRGFLLFALRKRFRPRLSAEGAATDTSGGKKACR